MGYGGVLPVKRNDHSSDYAFDFSHSQGEDQLDIADYTLYEGEEQPGSQREHHHEGTVSHDYAQAPPHHVQYDYLERESDFSHYDDEEYPEYAFPGFDYSLGGFDYF